MDDVVKTASLQSAIDSEPVRQGMLAMSPEEFEAALDELSADSEQLLVLPSEAIGREGIYMGG